MKKEEVINQVKEALQTKDEDSSLVNFWDDEVDWNEIAKVAVETLSICFDEVPWEQL